jgi:hypothetical protein
VVVQSSISPVRVAYLISGIGACNCESGHAGISAIYLDAFYLVISVYLEI